MKLLNRFVLLIVSIPILGPATAQELKIIPQPNSYHVTEGKFNFTNNLSISTEDAVFSDLIPVFSSQLLKYTGIECTIQKHNPAIKLIRSSNPKISNEAYQLLITPTQIQVSAISAEGAFYGLQSLVQLLLNAKQNGESLSCGLIEDAPRYAWRGFMLDESRHFFGRHEVKKILDMMALHKLNKFHWHLTDVPGWRIQIEKYPLLTSVGGRGIQSDPEAPAAFYTQDEIREIVKYASDRFIEIIPEIDMPGHATAAVKAYPEFSGGGSADHPDFTFHPAREGTYVFLTDILREVATLFPSQFVHIGGDEVHFGNQDWSTFPEVSTLMEQNGLKDLVDVEHYFLTRMADSIRVLGKTVMGWDEVTSAGLDNKNTWVMWWRHDKPELLKKAVDEGFAVILCPRRPLYFDFVQHESHKEGRRWDGFCPIEDVYDFPNAEMAGGESYKSSLVKGIQANAWTETMHTPQRLEFMVFPRLSALAEAAWTTEAEKDYARFKNNLSWMISFYENQGIYTFDPLKPDRIEEEKGARRKN